MRTWRSPTCVPRPKPKVAEVIKKENNNGAPNGLLDIACNSEESQEDSPTSSSENDSVNNF